MLMLILVVMLLQVAQPSPFGHWEGFMQRGSSRLAVRFDFLQVMPRRGLFSAPDLGAIDVPLTNLSEGSTVHWELVGDVTTTVFDGTVVGDSMTGTFREDKRAGTFRLSRVSTSTEKPYTEDEVTFVNGDVQLAGTLFAPRAPGEHPAVILVAGSGPEGRWAMKYIADYLARHGMVALAYDKRGVGASNGDWRTATMEDLVGDARAGVDLIAKRADVDPHKVGVYGHSQGAEIAPAIAENNPNVRWIAEADGPVGPQYLQDLYRVDTALAERYSGQDLAAAERLYAEFVDVARSGGSHEQLRVDMQKAGDASWLDFLAIPDDSDWIWGWYRKVGNYDNTQAWGSVNVPVLVLFGSNDHLVPPQASITDTVSILKAHGNTDVIVRVFKGADHTLRIPPSTPDGWPQSAPGFPDVIGAFAIGALHP